MIRKLALVPAVLLLLVACSFAAAAEEEAPPPARFSFDLIGEYTDNRDSAQAKVPTFDFSIKPRLDVYLDWKRGLLDLYYAPSYRFRTRPTSADRRHRLFHDAALELRHELTSRLQFKLKDSLYYTDNPEVEAATTTFLRDSSYLLNELDAGFLIDLGRTTILDMAGRHSYKYYDDPAVRPVANETSLIGGLGLWQALSRTWSVGLMGNLEDFAYPDAGEGIRDFTSGRGYLSLRKKLGAHLTARADGGWKQITFEDTALGQSSGPYGRFALTGQTHPSFRLSASASYELRDSDNYPYASQQYTGIRGGLEWDIVSALTLGLSGAYRIGVYDASDVPSGHPNRAAFSGGREDVLLGAAGLTYRVAENNALRLLQRYESMDTELTEDYTRNTTVLSYARQF